MKLAWPGGRWVRHLRVGDGHCSGHVQAFKRPTLPETRAPLFMSYPVRSNAQYRPALQGGSTLIALRHTALGLITAEHRAASIDTGWRWILERTQARAQAS